MRRAVARWNKQLGEFELRCDDCAAKTNVVRYWPLTTEFWNPKSMVRCRACHLELERRRKRALGKEVRNEQMRQWRARNPGYNAAMAALSRKLHPEARRESDRRYDAKRRLRKAA